MTHLKIALPVPFYHAFDYLWTEKYLLPIGARVRVPLGKRTAIGICIGHTDQTEHENLKEVLEVIDIEPVFSADCFALCVWIADYYHYPLGQVLAQALPAPLRQGKSATLSKKASYLLNATPLASPLMLMDEQAHALSMIEKQLHHFHVFLLQGITGSGKTEVYLQSIARVLSEQKQVLVLVPEIGLTPQTIDRFYQRFAVPIITFHSKMNDRERLDAWIYAEQSTAKIIIGTRSSIFLPLPDLGLIIIDEEHDLSYKQQDRCRYHARDVAIIRAQSKKIPIILGSATPSLESLYNVEKKKYTRLTLSVRPGLVTQPSVSLIDIRHQTLTYGLSHALIEAIKIRIAQGEQVLLFLNRRGYAPILLCHACGFIARCTRCDVAMTLHQRPRYLHCHHCDQRREKPPACPQCHSRELQAIGLGTERIEEGLKKLFPDTPLIRVDRDSTQGKNSFHTIVADINAGKYQLLLGTQMLAKGHHFPELTLVGIIDMDSAFFSSDFRAPEFMGQLITQVAGRAGRAEKKGHVMIQTHHPEHPLLCTLIRDGFNAFADHLLQDRKAAHLPPICYIALIRAQAKELKQAIDFLNQVKDKINSAVTVLGPIPAAMPKRANAYFAHLLLQADQRALLQQTLTPLARQMNQLPLSKRVRWIIDVDPLETV